MKRKGKVLLDIYEFIIEYGWAFLVLAIALGSLLVVLDVKYQEDSYGVVNTGVDYVRMVDDVCYDAHNPYNNKTNYRESWGSAYRMCILDNLNIE